MGQTYLINKCKPRNIQLADNSAYTKQTDCMWCNGVQSHQLGKSFNIGEVRNSAFLVQLWFVYETFVLGKMARTVTTKIQTFSNTVVCFHSFTLFFVSYKQLIERSCCARGENRYKDIKQASIWQVLARAWLRRLARNLEGSRQECCHPI